MHDRPTSWPAPLQNKNKLHHFFLSFLFQMLTNHKNSKKNRFNFQANDEILTVVELIARHFPHQEYQYRFFFSLPFFLYIKKFPLKIVCKLILFQLYFSRHSRTLLCSCGGCHFDVLTLRIYICLHHELRRNQFDVP